MEDALNRMLTKDETVYATGFVGEGTSCGPSKQLQEPTTFRQRFQLQPTMYTKIGAQQYVQGYESFLDELQILGVDKDRLPLWGNSLLFNWIPPINIDMFINYGNYLWAPISGVTTIPDYFVIESRCNKVTQRRQRYEQVVQNRGPTQDIVGIDPANNTFTILGYQTDLYVKDFVFYTKSETNTNIADKFWTTLSSTYDQCNNTTIITVVQDIPIRSTTQPPGTSYSIGRWWYNPDTDELKQWNGTTWIKGVVRPNGVISLEELLTIFIGQQNCICAGSVGWDIRGWDDNPCCIVWNANLLALITWPTETAWINANGLPVPSFGDNIAGVVTGPGGKWIIGPGDFTTNIIDGCKFIVANNSDTNSDGVYECDSVFFNGVNTEITVIPTQTIPVAATASGVITTIALWYNTTDDTLLQRLPDNSGWGVIQGNFSAVLSKTNGLDPWDLTIGCPELVQVGNQWTQANQWINRLSTNSTSFLQPAKVPILEYDSMIEMNKWSKTTFVWKYRAQSTDSFAVTTYKPTRLELEPVKQFQVVDPNTIRLYDVNIEQDRDIDYTRIFVPGYKFIVRNQLLNFVHTYTVDYSEFIEVEPNLMATVVHIVETYITPTLPITQQDLFITPVRTSVGDPFAGYHVQWLLDQTATIEQASVSYPNNPILQRTIDNVPVSYTIVNVTPTAWIISGNHATEFVTGQNLNVLNNTGGGNGAFVLASALNVGPDTQLTLTTSTPFGATADGILQRLPTFTYNVPVFPAPVQIKYDVGAYYQQARIFASGVSTIDLDPSLQFNPTANNVYALAGQEALRVYLNGVRQYGTYTENTQVGTVTSGTFVKNNIITTDVVNYVESITFTSPLKIGDVVTFELGSASLTDMSYYSVPVRTVESDADFNIAVAANQQPVYVNLDTYRKVEQAKNTVNQYPYFNIYNTVTNEFYKASPVFGYLENPDAEINAALNLRVQRTDEGDFFFDQFLLDENNGKLYAYRRYGTLTAEFWYNPTTNVVQFWTGETWTQTFSYVQPSTSNIVAVTPYVGTTPPSYLVTIDGSIWFNTTTEQLYRSNGTIWQLVLKPNTQPNWFISETDPTLSTIWRHGKNNEEYVPQYVNKNREPVPITDPNGTWELADQWYFNPEHENHKYITNKQLLTHFSTIIDSQPPVPGIPEGGVFTLTQSEFNYGLGGTIHDYNDSYDTLMSAMNNERIAPTGVINFAQDQYAQLLLTAKETYIRGLPTIYLSTSTESFLDFDQAVADSVVNSFALNSVLETVYGDSNAYDLSTNTGVKNWIATAPMFGLAPKYEPYLLFDNTLNISQLVHHDGHRSSVVFSLAEIDQLISRIINQPDVRVSGKNIGISKPTIPPLTESQFELPTNFGTPIRNGVYWLQTQATFTVVGVQVGNNGWWEFGGNLTSVFFEGSSFVISGSGGGNGFYIASTVEYDGIFNKTKVYVSFIANTATPTGIATVSVRWLYRFNVIACSNIPPSLFYNGSPLPNGTKYYNTYNNTLFEVQFPVWQPVTTIGDGIISAAWEYINIEQQYANTLLNIEQRLYDVTPDYDELVFDFSSLTPTPEEQSLYDFYMKEQFYRYLRERGITAPFVSFYAPSNPFTWNYSNSIVTTYPTTNTNIDVAGSWQETYTRFYGTPYPHLESWKIQGYINPPRWWNSLYADTTGNRRWQPLMWTNINLGIVPAGELLPDGITVSTGAPAEVTPYTYVSVNTTAVNIISGGRSYKPDDLFPPFVSGLIAPMARSIFNDYNTEIVAPQRDYSYGEVGFREWQWLQSGQYVYDPLIVAFKMQPVRFMHYAFGEQFVQVDELQIDTRNQKVFAHQDTIFYGELYTPTEIYTPRGLNEWYVNYNRFYGYDVNGEFRDFWITWTPLLTYLTGSIIDTSTLDVFSKVVEFVKEDYNVVLAQDKNIDDVWFEAFNVTVMDSPPILTQYNTQAEWRLSINGLSPVINPIEYYEPKVYPMVVEPIYKVKIIGVTTGLNGSWTVQGNYAGVITIGSMIEVTGTQDGDGIYPITNVVDVGPNTVITITGLIANTTVIPLNGGVGYANAGLLTLFKYNILYSNAAAKTFGVLGDQTEVFRIGTTFNVEGTPANNGLKTVVQVTYNASTDSTIITVAETIYDGVDQGFIDAQYVDNPWETGELIILQSTKLLPAPLTPNIPLYAIRLNNKQLMLAFTKEEAEANVAVTLTTSGEGLLTAGIVVNTFNVQGLPVSQSNIWYNFDVDKTKIRTFIPPFEFAGIQNLINIINGYNARLRDKGFVLSDTIGMPQDPYTGRIISWQWELERFVYWAYQLRRKKNAVGVRYEFMIDSVPTTEISFLTTPPEWANGTKVSVLSSGNYPEPIIAGVPYYVVRTSDPYKIKLSISSNITNISNYVTFTTQGSGQLYLQPFAAQNTFPVFEINPFRTNIWLDTPVGIISDVLAGNIEGTEVQQGIFDQYGRLLTDDVLKVYRQDRQSHIAMKDGIPNDVVPSKYAITDPYNFIHMGSGHIFFDGYEHAILFNDYSTQGCLVYDPFLGLNIAKIDMNFFRTVGFTLRPTIGGYYLLDGKFLRNIEGSIDDMRYFYDTQLVREGTPPAIRSRLSVGYTGLPNFMEDINATTKTGFMFYQGMIEYKGTNAAVDAYTNSVHYNGAIVDEFWAWRIAQYGDSRRKVYPEIKMYAQDGQVEDVRFQFMQNYEYDATDPAIIDLRRNGFEIITESSVKRWVDLPEQLPYLENFVMFNNAEVSSIVRIYANTAPPPSGQETSVEFWFNKTDYITYRWNGTSWVPADNQFIVYNSNPGPFNSDIFVEVKTNDGVLATRKSPYTYVLTYSGPIVSANKSPDYWVIPGTVEWISSVVPVSSTFTITNNFDGGNGVYTVTGLQGDGENTRVYVTPGSIPLTVPNGVTDGTGAFPSISVPRNQLFVMLPIFNAINGYERTNSEVVRFQFSTFQDYITLFTLNVAESRLNPARLIDDKANVMVAEVPIWDPARGYYYYVAEHNIDLTNSTTPARYSVTINPLDTSDRPWNYTEVGTRWFDTSNLGYSPYYDDIINPNINDRLYNWGHLADWATVDVYEWIESPVPPETYDQYVQAYANNFTIPQNEKPSGEVRRQVYRRDRTPFPSNIDVYQLTGINTTPPNSTSGVYTTWQVDNDITARLYFNQSWNVENCLPTISNGTYQAQSWNYNTTTPGKTSVVVNPLIPISFGPILDISGPANGFVISGNQTANFTRGTSFFIVNSPIASNDGNYTVVSSSFDGVNTTITVQEPISTVFNIVGVNSGSRFWTLSGDQFFSIPVGSTVVVQGNTGTGNGPYLTGSFTYALVGVNTVANISDPNDYWIISGDVTARIPVNSDFIVTGCPQPGGNGTYRVEDITFDGTNTFVFVGNGSIPPTVVPTPPVVPQGTVTYPAQLTIGGNTNIAVGSIPPGAQPDGFMVYGVGGTIILGVTEFGTMYTYKDRVYINNADPVSPLQPTDIVLFTADVYPTFNGGIPVNAVNGIFVVNTVAFDTPLNSWYITLSYVEDITTPVVFDTGGFNVNVVPAFKSTEWVEYPTVHEKFTVALNPAIQVSPTFTLDSMFYPGDTVDVYVNGALQEAAIEVSPSLTITTTAQYTINDFVTIVRPPKILTEEEIRFDPDVQDDGTINTQYAYSYDHTEVTFTSNNTTSPVTQVRYYFWVKNKQTFDPSIPSRTSAFDAQETLRQIPIPYMVFQGPIVVDPRIGEKYGWGMVPYGLIWDTPWVVPGDTNYLFYRKAILRRAASLLSADDRLILRFTQDLTLRDNLNDFPLKVNLKNKHTEWLLIRRFQESKIDRRLWDKLTERLAGRTIADPNTLVPALNRVAYDAIFGTDTQYGLQTGRRFVKKEYGLATVLNYLGDPNKNPGVDIAAFFGEYNFDTPANIIESMEYIYNNFPTDSVNGIFFDTLLDSFVTRYPKYARIMKTSWVAVEGIKPFDIGGFLDG